MFVKQAAHVLELLEFFAERQRPATLSEVAEAKGWPRSSTFNILSTLVDKGYLYEPRARAGFYPTPRWLALTQAVANAQPLPGELHSLLTEIMEESGETALVVAPAGTSAIFLDVIESRGAIKYVAEIGHRVPITATASGRAILSQYDRRERDALLRKVKFERLTEATLVSVEAVEAELKRASERGYHVNPAGNVPDLQGIAVPLQVEMRHLSVAVAGPIFRVGGREQEIADIIIRAIRRYGLAVAE